MTSSITNPDPVHETTPSTRRRRLPRFGLSATQLVATALAATTATFLASYLGVSGTIIGAAVASVATAVGNAVYGQSLRTTRDRVRTAVPVLALRTDPASPTIVRPAREEPPALPAPGRTPDATDAARAWRRVAFAAIGIFVVVLGVVTGVEVLAGRPVADLVRGDAGAGTTLFGVSPRTTTITPPVPTVTVTVTPKVVVTTPTVTQTAPAVTTPADPTPTTPAPTTPVGTGTPSTPAPPATGGASTAG